MTCAISKTKETDLMPLADEKLRDQDEKTFQISDVNLRQLLDLRRRTKGDIMICV